MKNQKAGCTPIDLGQSLSRGSKSRSSARDSSAVERSGSKAGFTLIEILIVVAIIAILASVVLVGLGPTQQAGRDSRRLSDIREAQTALELYFNKCGYYPGGVQSSTPCGAFTAETSWASLTASVTGSGIGVDSFPIDPTSGHTYYYGTTAGGADYVLAAALENINNSVFDGYVPPSQIPTTMVGASGAPAFVSCAPPTYCISL